MSSYVVSTLNDHGTGSLREGIKYANSISSSNSFHMPNSSNSSNSFHIPNSSSSSNSSNSSSLSNSSNSSSSSNSSDSSSSSNSSSSSSSSSCENKITITFAVSGTIKLKQDLPTIEVPISIISEFNDGKPSICIDGDKKYSTIQIVNTCGCVINGLSIVKSSRSGIVLHKANSNQIYNCWIGIDIDGKIAPNIKNGIAVIDSCSNTIGFNDELNQEYFSNILSGNKNSGIYLLNSCNNLIQNNIIGLDSTGNLSIPNKCDGIRMIKCCNNIIGGKIFIDINGNINDPTGNKGQEEPVFVRPLLGNIISANLSNGIKIIKSQNINLYGNFIGTDKTGNVGLGNKSNGICIVESKFTNIIGADFTNNPFVFYNVVSGNNKAGICNYGSEYTLIQANFVGTGANNSSGVPNGIGIYDENSTNTIVGGVIPLGNVIAGNLTWGLYVTTGSDGFTSINTFCGLKAFGNALPNGSDGFMFNSNAKNIKVNTNVISGNQGNGIVFTDDVEGIILTSNIIGLNTAGAEPVPNKLSGVVIGGRVKNLNTNVQLTSVIQKNVISANGDYGMILKDNSNHNVITQLNLGLDYFGIIPITNGKGGLLITNESNNNVVGLGVELDAFNFICDRDNFAIKLDCGTFSNRITNNFINIATDYHEVLHNENIVNLSNDNVVTANNLPYTE